MRGFHRYTWLGGLLLILTGCVMQPQAFRLYDPGNHPWTGRMNPKDGSLSVDIQGKHFQGFYIVSHATMVSSTPAMLFDPSPLINTLTDVSMNNARATLSAPDGERLSCQFVFHLERALGDCLSSSGIRYQWVADGEPAPH